MKVKKAAVYSFNCSTRNRTPVPSAWDKLCIVHDFTPSLIHIWPPWRGKLDYSSSRRFEEGIPYGHIGSIPFGGRLLIIKILGSTPMCTKPQKQEKKIIHSEIRNILHPVIILFWTRIVTLPSLDSWVKSLHQPLTPSSSSILAIINIVSLTILNHR